jgi:hypothetical protein
LSDHQKKAETYDREINIGPRIKRTAKDAKEKSHDMI